MKVSSSESTVVGKGSFNRKDRNNKTDIQSNIQSRRTIFANENDPHVSKNTFQA